MGRYEAEAAAAGFGPALRSVSRISDRYGAAGQVAVVAVILVLVCGFIAGGEAAFGSTGLWITIELFTVAALLWASINLRQARSANAAPQTIARYTRSTWGLAFWAVLTLVRLLTHSY